MTRISPSGRVATAACSAASPPGGSGRSRTPIGRGAAADRATSARPQPRDLALAGPAQAIPLPDLVRRLLLWRGRPWTFRDLQTAVADLLGIRDRPLLSLSGDSEGDGHGGERESPEAQARLDPPETRAGAHRELEGRQFLTALWLEVRELPVGQRRALLAQPARRSGA